jgi:hypothetical protein
VDNSNKKKYDQLGMPFGTAGAKLRKTIIFDLIVKCGLDVCFQCGRKIERVEDFSIEHKQPWLDSENPVGMFFDLNNIAFSHLSCNVGAARSGMAKRPMRHGDHVTYKRGCRCDECRAANARHANKYR